MHTELIHIDLAEKPSIIKFTRHIIIIIGNYKNVYIEHDIVTN